MKWNIQVEWEKADVVNIRFIEDDKGYDTKEKALDRFAESWLKERGFVDPHCFDEPIAKSNPFEPQTNREGMKFENGHSYHWEHKQGEDWSSHTLVDDTIAEQKAMVRDELIGQALNEEAEQKKEEEKKRPCENCENSEWDFHGWRCKRFGQPIKMDRQTCIADEREKERKPVFYSKTFPPTIEKRLEALEKKVEELEKRIETIFQNTRENHAEMFERVCGLERRLRNY